MHIFVTGASGLIGRRLVAALCGRGDTVTALSRSADPGRPFPRGCEVVAGDPTRGGPWLDHLDRCDAVVHLAGEPVMARRWRSAFKQRLLQSRVDSTRLIAETLARRAVRSGPGSLVFVSASAIGYYGVRGDEELDEEGPPGNDFLAQVCVAWENATDVARDAGVRVANVRIGVVLDPAGGALPKLVRPFRWFLGGPIASGRQWVSWVHRDDLTGLLLLALDDARVAGPLNGTAPEPVKNWGFCKTLAKVMRRPCWLPVPRLALRVALGEAAGAVADGQRVLPCRALRLGYAFRFPDLEGALRDLVGRGAVGGD